MNTTEATRTARTYRTAARLHRFVAACTYSPTKHWFDLLCAQLEREEQESIARRLEEQAEALDAAVTEHEANRAELLARGAELAA